MAIRAERIMKNFGEPPTTVLSDINFEIPDGQFVSISGRSGSGKTTLLYLLSTLDNPSSGRTLIDGQDPAQLSVDAVHEMRNRRIGFIFQFHYLLPELNAIENVLFPARRQRRDRELTPRARELLERFGLGNKETRFPGQLSGGEQQRVAIARSLILSPTYLFADEPTGNLDSANGLVVMNLLKSVNREEKTTIVLVTHEPEFAAMAEREIKLVDGRLA